MTLWCRLRSSGKSKVFFEKNSVITWQIRGSGTSTELALVLFQWKSLEIIIWSHPLAFFLFYTLYQIIGSTCRVLTLVLFWDQKKAWEIFSFIELIQKFSAYLIVPVALSSVITDLAPFAAHSKGECLFCCSEPVLIYRELLLPKGVDAFKEASPPMSCCAITFFNNGDLLATLTGSLWGSFGSELY